MWSVTKSPCVAEQCDVNIHSLTRQFVQLVSSHLPRTCDIHVKNFVDVPPCFTGVIHDSQKYPTCERNGIPYYSSRFSGCLVNDCQVSIPSLSCTPLSTYLLVNGVQFKVVLIPENNFTAVLEIPNPGTIANASYGVKEGQ
ncbi:hypothetical protein TNCV_3018281 [Trichonephila clavipes]|nr:hypothetical protein TNCV_3018281 [Trichonephila clavipes]